MTDHSYAVTVTWTGGETATAAVITAAGPGSLPVAADPAFGGPADRWNPEQLLVAALAQCHLLVYLHLCRRAGVRVTGYAGAARGTMSVSAGQGRFTEVVLEPVVTVAAPAEVAEARRLHDVAHTLCFIANSVNFPVRHSPVVSASPGTGPLGADLRL